MRILPLSPLSGMSISSTTFKTLALPCHRLSIRCQTSKFTGLSASRRKQSPYASTTYSSEYYLVEVSVIMFTSDFDFIQVDSRNTAHHKGNTSPLWGALVDRFLKGTIKPFTTNQNQLGAPGSSLSFNTKPTCSLHHSCIARYTVHEHRLRCRYVLSQGTVTHATPTQNWA